MDGKEIWRFRAGGLVAVGVLVKEGKIYFGSEDFNFYCLDLKRGKEIWRFKTSGQIWSPPALWKDSLLFGSWDCHLYCLNLKGNEVWRFATSDRTICKVDPPYKVFEVVVKKEETGEEKEDKKYEVNLTKGFEDIYETESEYQVKVEYQQSMKY